MIQKIYAEKREIILYLFFGGLTFMVSVASFALFHVRLGLNELLANILSWIIAVLFAFFTNRIWVFQAKTKTFRELWEQMGAFFAGRLLTLGIEEVILLVFITWLEGDSMLVKIVAQVVVIVLNYVISKLWIFKK